MEKNIKMLGLLDVYGALLTQRQREIAGVYFGCDLSLSEVAENLDITKQAVSDAVTKISAALNKYESALSLVHIKEQILSAKKADGQRRTEILDTLIQSF